MGSGRLVDFLKEHSGSVYYPNNGRFPYPAVYYKSTNNGWIYSYGTYLADKTLVESKLAEMKGAAVASISAISTETGENAFHFILSDKLFMSSKQVNAWIIPPSHYAAVRARVDSGEDGSNSARHIISETLDRKLNKEKIVLGSANFASTEIAKIIELLFNAYVGNENGLVSALMHIDGGGNLPLNLGFKNFKLFDVVKNQIKKLSPGNKQKLAKAQDKLGETFVHLFIVVCSLDELKELNKILGADIMLEVLQVRNTDGNTILHTLLQQSNGVSVVEKVEFINTLFTAKPAAVALAGDAKANPVVFKHVDRVVDGNSCRENVLHLAARRADDSLQKMTQAMTKDLRFRLLQQADLKSMTPLHDAIKTKQAEKVSALLKDLTQEEKNTLLAQPTATKDSVLHLVCREGNTAILQDILDAFGEEQLAALYLQHSDELASLATHNPEINDYNYQRLIKPKVHFYLPLDYLRKNGPRFVSFKSDESFFSRAKHFCETVKLVADGKEAPSANEFFKPNARSGNQYYHAVTAALADIKPDGSKAKAIAMRTYLSKAQGDPRKDVVAFLRATLFGSTAETNTTAPAVDAAPLAPSAPPLLETMQPA